MDPSSCPFCHLEVPSSELEWHANSHFEVEDEDEQLARDLEFAQQLALAPSSPPSSSMNSQAISDLPISRCDAQISMEEKVSCLIALQTRNTFYEIEHGLMALMKDCLESERGNTTSIVSGYIDHFQSIPSEDVGWGCGWRNIQMLSSHLLMQRHEAREVLFGGSGFVPDIPSLQRWLEIAWEKGFDELGSDHFANNIYGSKKWIGTTECAALFRSFGLRARIVDFGPKELESFYPLLPGSSLGKEVERIHNGGKRKAIQVCGPMDRYLLARNHDVSQASSSGDEKSGCSSIPLGDSLGSKSNENLGNKFTRNSKGHQVLIDWIWNYFSDKIFTKSGNHQVVVSDKTTWQVLGPGMKYSFQFPKICHVETRRCLFLLGVLAVTYVSFQSLLLPYGNALWSLLPQNEVQEQFKGSGVFSIHSSAKSVMVRNPLTVHSSLDFIDVSMFSGVEKDAGNSGLGGEIGHDRGRKGKDVHKEIDLILEEKGIDNTFANTIHGNVDHNFPSENVVDTNGSLALVSIENQENGSVQDKANVAKYGFPLERIVLPNYETSTENTLKENSNLAAKKSDGVKTGFPSSPLILPAAASLANATNASVGSTSFKSDVVTSKNGSVVMKNPGRKKMKSELPPKSITSIYEMNHILVRHRASSRSLRPRWSSVRDQDILAVKSQIEHPPVAINDRELYGPLFRNVSMFKRSYELMERTLKIYIYKDGNKPIFHQPILKGLYASEGWFMKLMQGYKRFVVKDPRKAHLFYMPFSSRMLEYTLYVRNSHNRTNLRQFLKEYSEKIAAKYPYWNRTGGADHFLVACHDWAPYETRHHMERCMKALCNADVTSGFKIGRDVSLPETYVRSARNPLRDLGGKPPSQRQILAFYAGNMHGYLRPILLEYWKDKDPDMKIFGPMPPGVASKMNYIQHMKSSKYCICPKGYEVNSPRVVEAIFYECVPVIISDNFVPPFFEVLDWGAFSVILAERDIPNLKEILLSIPEEKYLQMQQGVRKVQKHFLWHAKPLKYDLFHMTLHSIWYNRVFQIKIR